MDKLLSKDLLGIRNLSVEEIKLIFDTADKFKEVLNRPIKKVPSLRHLTIANVFFENSTRTKLSFELAQKRLSADIINFSSSLLRSEMRYVMVSLKYAPFMKHLPICLK